MSYSQFTLKQLVQEFHLTLKENTKLFPNVQSVSPTELLSMTLQESLPLATAINKLILQWWLKPLLFRQLSKVFDLLKVA